MASQAIKNDSSEWTDNEFKSLVRIMDKQTYNGKG